MLNKPKSFVFCISAKQIFQKIKTPDFVDRGLMGIILCLEANCCTPGSITKIYFIVNVVFHIYTLK